MLTGSLKKQAQERGFTERDGMAYGECGGFLCTLRDAFPGAEVNINVSFGEDGVGLREVMQYLEQCKKEYSLQAYRYSHGILAIRTTSIKKVPSILETFPTVFREAGALSSIYCWCCDKDFFSGSSEIVLVNGNAARMHTDCIDRLNDPQSAGIVLSAGKPEKRKSIPKGILGALGGAILGALPWALVYYLGYYAAIVGLLITFLIKTGWELLGGKDGKVKTVVCCVLLLPSVVLGQYLGDLLSVLRMIRGGELAGFVRADAVWLVNTMLAESAEYREMFLRSILVGCLFALLGAYLFFQQMRQKQKEEGPPQIVRLDQYSIE